MGGTNPQNAAGHSFFYRNLVKPAILEIPKAGALNLHPSLLPKYRGHCPINWVLIHGEKETGVTLHYMTPRPDDGDVVAQRRIEITEEDTAPSLAAKVARIEWVPLGELLPPFEDIPPGREGWIAVQE